MQMAVAGASEQLVELLSRAARTQDGEVRLLTSSEVARVLGRHRNWVQRNAARLGGLRLPDSDEWRFTPGGVAAGLLASQDDAAAVGRDDRPAVAGRAGGRRLAYPPAKKTLADRPRRAEPNSRGEPDAPASTWKR